MREYKRKHKYNDKYAGKYTKRALSKRVDSAWVIIILIIVSVIAQNIFEPTNDMTIPAKVEVPNIHTSDIKSLLTVVEPQEIKESEANIYNPVEITVSNDLISDYIRSKDWNDEHALLIFNCESNLIADRFNPETESKRKGLTKYSSCGVAQINSPLCVGANGKCVDNPLCDYKYNIDVAYEMWTRRGWQPWINCSARYKIPWYS